MSETLKQHVQVRVTAELASQVSELAEVERRSFANMVEVLLVRALASQSREPAERLTSINATIAGSVRPHMKKNRPAVECPTRWPSGVCPDCGQTI